jgi:tetratricopeptide (TPR) repeat protein
MNKNKVLLAFGVLIVVLISVFFQNRVPNPIPVSSKDSNVVWSFQASHKDGGSLEKQVEEEVNNMEDQLGTGVYADQELLISISNKYKLLGDGKKVYKYLVKAINVGGAESGLAWNNMGQLLSRVNAPYTALIAYSEAVRVDPNELTYHASRIGLVVEQFPSEMSMVEEVFSDAEKIFPNDKSLLQLRTQWLLKSKGVSS